MKELDEFIKQHKNNKEKSSDFNTYLFQLIDERGYKKFGPIPTQRQFQTNFKINTQDDDPRRVRTSNPRYNFEDVS